MGELRYAFICIAGLYKRKPLCTYIPVEKCIIW